jgi:uncharacterized protein YcbK (DUF882 family)
MRVSGFTFVSFVFSFFLCAGEVFAQRVAPPESRVYIVVPGDTLLRVANRLGVQPRDLAARNNLPRPYTLNVGQRLRLPLGVSPDVLIALPTREEATNSSSPQGTHRAGFVSLLRARDNAELTTNFTAAAPNLRVRVERFMRTRANRQHIVHPRMVRTLQLLSDRFGGRRIIMLSGYRPAHAGDAVSRHSLGQAMDLRIEGVPLRDVWTFCQSLPNMGCGIYIRSNYVHVDVRTAPEHWEGMPRRTGPVREPVRMLDADPDEDVAVVLADAAPTGTPANEKP